MWLTVQVQYVAGPGDGGICDGRSNPQLPTTRGRYNLDTREPASVDERLGLSTASEPVWLRFCYRSWLRLDPSRKKIQVFRKIRWDILEFWWLADVSYYCVIFVNLYSACSNAHKESSVLNQKPLVSIYGCMYVAICKCKCTDKTRSEIVSVAIQSETLMPWSICLLIYAYL